MRFLKHFLSLTLCASLASAVSFYGLPSGKGNVEASSVIGGSSNANVISQNVGKAVGDVPSKGVKASNLLGTMTNKNIVNQNINAGKPNSVSSLKASNSIVSGSNANLVNQNIGKKNKWLYSADTDNKFSDILTDISAINNIKAAEPKNNERSIYDLPSEPLLESTNVEAVSIIGASSNKNAISQNIGVSGENLKDLKASSAVEDNSNKNIVSQNVRKNN